MISRELALPLDDLREVFGNQALVVGLDLLDVNRLIALAVEVIRVEGTYGLEGTGVVGVREMSVCAFAVPRVEGVVADHVQRIHREGALLLEDMVEVLQIRRE